MAYTIATEMQQISLREPARQYSGQPPPSDRTLSLLLPLLILLSSLLFLLLVFLLFLIVARRRKGISLPIDDGPHDLAREEEFEGEGGLEGVEQRWLDTVDEATKTGYIRAKAWQTQFPPNSQPTDITLTQFLAIQEKGVSAWAFEPDFDSISPPFVIHGRTEITFLADGIGMSRAEGGGACVQCNLPVPKLNEVYYWEAKLHEKPDSTNVAIGLATKPYPSFRLPGWNKFSVGYFSEDGFKSHNYPFSASSYGPPLLEGDVIGLGYRPRTGAVFFTRNGKKLEDAYVGVNRHNFFPTIGADGQAVIHVNLGQAGFVFIEANVKKWGLAPSTGTLAPPPAYGSERGSILLETANGSQLTPQNQNRISRNRRVRARPMAATRLSMSAPQFDTTRRSRQSQSSDDADYITEESVDARSDSDQSAGSVRASSPVDSLRLAPHNPPTPNLLDISLHSLHSISPLQRRLEREAAESSDSEYAARPPPTPIDENGRRRASYRRTTSSRSVQPPTYHMVDPNTYAPGVAEAILGESSYAQFQAAQSGNWAALSQSIPSGSVYEGRTQVDDPNGDAADDDRPILGLMERLRGWTRRGDRPQPRPEPRPPRNLRDSDDVWPNI